MKALDLRAARVASIARSATVPLSIYALSRAVDTTILLLAPGHSDAGGRRAYGSIITSWDGRWYQAIAEHGYPHSLPVLDGRVQQNPWAFYPGFPGLCRALMATGLPYGAAASIVSVVSAGVGCCLLYAMVRSSASRFTATMAVVGFCFFPAAVVLQAAYAESLAFALIAGALFALSRRRYGWFSACAVALSLTRPVALPLAAVAGLHLLMRWRRRAEDPLPADELAWALAATVTALLSFGVWPLIAAVVTGEPNAYVSTARTWALDGHWQTWLSGTVRGGDHGLIAVLTISTVSVVALLALRRSASAWPSELRVWSVGYVVYLVVTTRVTPSIIRYLMLAITPWWPAPSFSERPQPRATQVLVISGVVLFGVLLQYLWAHAFLFANTSGTAYP